MNEHQRNWQRIALTVLLDPANHGPRGPWLPASWAVMLIRQQTGCTTQAANGSLRALLTVGLADSCRTHEGLFWKATDAAERMRELEGVAA